MFRVRVPLRLIAGSQVAEVFVAPDFVLVDLGHAPGRQQKPVISRADEESVAVHDQIGNVA